MSDAETRAEQRAAIVAAVSDLARTCPDVIVIAGDRDGQQWEYAREMPLQHVIGMLAVTKLAAEIMVVRTMELSLHDHSDEAPA